MTLVERATPVPGPGQALVRVEAAGVNFLDIYQRSGQYPVPLPIPLGSEGAGVVEAGVLGSYATHVLAPVERLVPVPSGVDSKVAAASMLQGMTAHYLAHT